MLKKISGFLLPVIIIFIAFSFGGTVLGIIALVAVTAYSLYKWLPSIYVTIGKYYYMKDNSKMLDYFEKAYATGRMSSEQKLLYAYLAMREGRMEKAERLFNAVLSYKHAPDFQAKARLNYALFLWKKGNLDEAFELTEEVFKDYKSTVSYGNYGYFLLMKGDLQKALEINLEAYDYNSSNSVIADNLGQNYYLLGQYDKSAGVFETLIEAKPAFPAPYYNYAKTLYALGDKEKACEMLNKALEQPFSAFSEVPREAVTDLLEQIESELKA